jgi:hypothetical protein
MAEFVEENIREIEIDLDNIPDSLIYRLPEVEFTFSPLAFGIDEYLQIEYYERKFERACPGLLNQFPCLYYLVEEMHAVATQKTPLDEILERQAPPTN